MKTLYLRWNTKAVEETPRNRNLAELFFKEYFSKVIIYNPEINMILDVTGRTQEVVNLDKNIQNSKFLSADVSRVYSLDGVYLRHNIKDLPRLTSNQVRIYDNDIIHGIGISKLKEALSTRYKETPLHFTTYSYFRDVLNINLAANKDSIEVLDLDDFINSGVVVEVGNQLVRFPYQTNEKLLKVLTGITEDKYFAFKKDFETLLVKMKEPESVDSARVSAIHTWAKDNNRKAFIIGVSGGLDSAVSLALLRDLQKSYPQENYTVVPVIAPIDSFGSTGQKEAAESALKICKYLGYVKPIVLTGLGEVSNSLVRSLNSSDNLHLIQQSDYWIRPAAFHNIAEKYNNSCMVGTVNKAEWELGWFSQYLDIFNLMPVIDLHKSQVSALARAYGLTGYIDGEPKGGLANNKTDEENFGFTYADFERYNSTVISSTNTKIYAMKRASEYKRLRFNTKYVFAIPNYMKG